MTHPRAFVFIRLGGIDGRDTVAAVAFFGGVSFDDFVGEEHGEKGEEEEGGVKESFLHRFL